MKNKRIKSGLITLVSIIAAVITTPAWSGFVEFANSKLYGFGIPTVVTALLAVVISELWKHIINISILKEQGVTSRSVKVSNVVDLY